MKRLLGVAQDRSRLNRFCEGFVFESLEWPETGVYGANAIARIEEACSQVDDLAGIDCILCEHISTAPLAFHLRNLGYSGPIVMVPHVNPYPTRNLLHTLLWSKIWSNKDVVVAGSPTTARLYESLFGLHSQSIPTYGIDETIYFPRDKAMARKLFNLARGPVLLYTGRFSPDKNIGALLATFQSIRKSIPDAQLVLAIRHQTGVYRQALSRQLAGVRILTDLAAEQLAHLYSAADIFVTCATSYYETFGRSPLEAVACGTTVVAPAWDGFKSYVSGGHGGRLVPVDFLADPLYDEWSYAMVNIPEMVRSCLDVLNGQHHADGTLDYNLTSQATVGRLNRLLQDLTDNDIHMASGIGIARIQDGRVWKAIEELGAIDLENIYRLTTCAEEALPVLTVNATRDLFVALYS